MPRHPLFRWITRGWADRRLPLALDVTNLGATFHVVACAVVDRGCSLPVAWAICLPVLRTRGIRTGRPGNYFPDLIVTSDDGRSVADLLNLVLEVSGEKKTDKDATVETAKTMWVPAVNNERTYGRWAFLELTGPNTAMQTIRKFLKS